ncbi:hypothetical protein [Nocardioides sp. cx-173]|uniref:hypothetical protein n=1 Tax=Nocardioides sp. cx-173 TaxID=2898796 RepID=UPI001E531441|nr:hypothetical protein [Nocardioides sp. cx-173]MCD4526448.1 hypothetical protein [Nocardioides sp. cx-173]UGB41137.1 hypothetical protein LQ940_17415 [Nocardioides sp. cx-173]
MNATRTDLPTATRWATAVGCGLGAAAAVGSLAAWARDDASDGITFAVFALLTLPFVTALAALLLDRTPRPERDEDSIESQWATRASSGAFYDTIAAMGLATVASSVLDTDSVPIWVFLVLGLLDMCARLVLLGRREG